MYPWHCTGKYLKIDTSEVTEVYSLTSLDVTTIYYRTISNHNAGAGHCTSHKLNHSFSKRTTLDYEYLLPTFTEQEQYKSY